MATLLQLIKIGKLTKLDPVLGPASMEERFVYLLPRAVSWLTEKMPTEKSTWNIEESPSEQVDGLMELFCAGWPLTVKKRFKCLLYRNVHGIWELKTSDVRMFGWFPKKNHFIISDCGMAGYIKVHNLYHGYCTQAQRERDILELNEPKFIVGDNPDDIVSNWNKT